MTYAEHQEQARAMAIDWQACLDGQDYSWEELAEWERFFLSLARRFGLVQEFRENGII